MRGVLEPTVAAMCRSFLRRKEATTVGQQGRGHCGLVTWALQGALGSPGKEGDMAKCGCTGRMPGAVTRWQVGVVVRARRGSGKTRSSGVQEHLRRKNDEMGV